MCWIVKLPHSHGISHMATHTSSVNYTPNLSIVVCKCTCMEITNISISFPKFITNSHTTYFIWLHSSCYKKDSLVRVIFLPLIDGICISLPVQVLKEAFYFCMLTLMPCINNEWQRAEVRLHAKLSDITSVSDEAILYWFLTYFQGKWLQAVSYTHLTLPTILRV